jgi:hypothetical protein
MLANKTKLPEETVDSELIDSDWDKAVLRLAENRTADGSKWVIFPDSLCFKYRETVMFVSGLVAAVTDTSLTPCRVWNRLTTDNPTATGRQQAVVIVCFVAVTWEVVIMAPVTLDVSMYTS